MRNYAQARFHYRKAAHLNAGDSKLFYKIACTYYNEGQWESAVKQLENALKIHRLQPEYNLLMGECKLQTGSFKDAIQYFSNVVRIRPKNIAGWEALIRCLFKAEFYEEAIEQIEAALLITQGKPLFIFYKSAVLFSMGKSKEAILYLERGMEKAPKLLKKFVELNPAILRHHQVVDIVARFKRNKSI